MPTAASYATLPIPNSPIPYSCRKNPRGVIAPIFPTAVVTTGKYSVISYTKTVATTDKYLILYQILIA
ncbi:MAG TPA: hypothetical protein VE944_12410 [Nostoc sp.]|uniref:hypothetical protein n=1 Tax=Nostoc sp. TaxID=1180 RepID=UPI002D626838|nr:hypothetical protein [Nostoc sp.]HYX15146.1 hypothetical protein [Nostoc sp.]